MIRSQEILILGGGLAGLSFAVALSSANKDLQITLLEAQIFRSGTPNYLDTRASALNLHSVDLLKAWGVWQEIENLAGPIIDIHVSHRGHFGSSLMSASDIDELVLGYVIENHLLGRALLDRAERFGVEIRAPVACKSLIKDGVRPAVQTSDGDIMKADLVLLAAGIERDWFASLGIEVNELEAGTCALAFNVIFPGQQHGRAFERFTSNGPLALLPLSSDSQSHQRFNVVWSVVANDIDDLVNLSDEDFIEQFQQEFGWRLGRVNSIGRRSQWPLVSRRASEQYRLGYLLVGNAAHTLHPVAGQGLNLSLREAAMLAQCIEENISRGAPLGSLPSLSSYLRATTEEQHLIAGSTDLLSKLFNHRGVLLDVPRDVSLAMLDFLPVLRHMIANFGAGRRSG